MKQFTVLSISLLILLAGCSRGPKPGEEAADSGRQWETVWVDPQIVSSDQLYTLIYATRIDSLPADNQSPVPAPGAEFELPDAGCLVTINLITSQGQVVRPLVVQRLPAGHYKLTLSRLPAESAGLRPGWYAASIAFCDRELRTEIYLQ